MDVDLKSLLGDEVNLPSDLLPEHDDEELEFGLELSDGEEESQCYSGLALSYYNSKHGTDFKYVKWVFFEGDYSSVHCAFLAAPSADVECRSAAKHFCSTLYGIDKCDLVVTSCCMVDGPESTDCKFCYRCSLDPPAPDVHKAEVPPLSQYSYYLADGVTTLSDKAKSRAPFALLALTYYNKKRHTDYKLVDALPDCLSQRSRHGIVLHCNFIARQNASDAPNKLFFAELMQGTDSWKVITCRVLRGKTTAGCHNCLDRVGKRVIHPTDGFRFGLRPERRRSSRLGRP